MRGSGGQTESQVVYNSGRVRIRYHGTAQIQRRSGRILVEILAGGAEGDLV